MDSLYCDGWKPDEIILWFVFVIKKYCPNDIECTAMISSTAFIHLVPLLGHFLDVGQNTCKFPIYLHLIPNCDEEESIQNEVKCAIYLAAGFPTEKTQKLKLDCMSFWSSCSLFIIRCAQHRPLTICTVLTLLVSVANITSGTESKAKDFNLIKGL